MMMMMMIMMMMMMIVDDDDDDDDNDDDDDDSHGDRDYTFNHLLLLLQSSYDTRTPHPLTAHRRRMIVE